MGIERIITQFRRVVENTQSTEALRTAVEDVSAWLGFRHFAITTHVRTSHGTRAIRLHNYPERWADYYEREGLGLIDPVHRASHLTAEGFWWSNMQNLIRLSARDQEIMALGRQQGIGEGFTIPVHIPGEACGTCTFVGEGDRPDHPMTEILAQATGIAAFGAARRLWPIRGRPVHLRPALTARQIECIDLVARGKTDWEIGQILGISEETVASHVRQACERYGVNKRTSLVFLALVDGVIMLSHP